MTDPATSLCKRLFLAHYFPRPTGLVTIRKLRNRFIVTATVAGVPTRRVLSFGFDGTENIVCSFRDEGVLQQRLSYHRPQTILSSTFNTNRGNEHTNSQTIASWFLQQVCSISSYLILQQTASFWSHWHQYQWFKRPPRINILYRRKDQENHNQLGRRRLSSYSSKTINLSSPNLNQFAFPYDNNPPPLQPKLLQRQRRRHFFFSLLLYSVESHSAPITLTEGNVHHIYFHEQLNINDKCSTRK